MKATNPDRPRAALPPRQSEEALIFQDVEEEGPPLYEESLGGDENQKEGRFGRWASWVEKRALERQNDPVREARRDARRELLVESRPPSYLASTEDTLNRPVSSNNHTLQRLAPVTSTLSREDFGSRFIPHSDDYITCALPLFKGNLIMLGTTRGLKVLDVHDPPARNIWTGLAVWSIQVLKSYTKDDRTPRGSVLVLCNGSEDPKRRGKPAKKHLEARVWKFGSLASLARWSATLYPDWEGLNLDRKGKEKLVLASAGGYMHPTLRESGSLEPPSESELEFAKAWASEYVSLRPTANGKPAEIVAVAAKVRDAEIYVALGTSNSVVLHAGHTSETGFSFRPSRQFYLPLAPADLGLVDLATQSRDLPNLGVFVSFGSKACVIRTNDSIVLDFKPPGKANENWLSMQTVDFHGEEMYLFTRGKETLVYMSPLRLPISVPPVVNIAWPKIPTSILAFSTLAAFQILATDVLDLHAQGAVATSGTLQLLPQESCALRDSTLLPISWSEDCSVYIVQDKRIAKLWRT